VAGEAQTQTWHFLFHEAKRSWSSFSFLQNQSSRRFSWLAGWSFWQGWVEQRQAAAVLELGLLPVPQCSTPQSYGVRGLVGAAGLACSLASLTLSTVSHSNLPGLYGFGINGPLPATGWKRHPPTHALIH
jgi:hypothetical protein